MRLISLAFILLLCRPANAKQPMPGEKVLLVRVDEIGNITVGRDTVGSDQLARYIQERLFKSYMGTGQMYDKIKFERKDAGVPDAVTEVVISEIKSGQGKALQELCLQKFRKTFETIDTKKQARLKKQFPVLFQTTYS